MHKQLNQWFGMIKNDLKMEKLGTLSMARLGRTLIPCTLIFSRDPRNVRLGFASDGFNPFRTMSVSHTTWSVVLINYNIPLWVSTKPEYLMLSLLIPNPSSQGMTSNY